MRLASAIAIAALGLAPALSAQAVRTLDPAAYRAELAETAAAVRAIAQPADARRLEAALPEAWRVGPNTVRLDWLHAELRTLSHPPPAPTLAAHTADRLEWMAREAASPGVEAPDARERLAAILARREFAAVEPESAWDRLRARIWAAIARFIVELLEHIPMSAGAGQGLVIVLLLAAFSGAISLALRLIEPRREELRLQGGAAPMPGWRECRERAERAALEGRSAEAVRMAYAAAAGYLAAEGLWRLDWTRTPREYLALLATGDPRRNDWRGLALRFEEVRYGGRNAGPETTRQALDHLRRLLTPAH